MQVKELIKKLLEFNLNQEVKLHTSTLAGYNCIEDILDVDQPNDTECDNVYLAGELDQCVDKTIKKNYVRKDVYEMLFDKCEKLESKLAEEVRRDTQEGKVAHLEEKCEHLEGVLQIRQDNLDFLHKKLSSQERARVMRIKDLKKRNDNLQNRIQDLYNRLEKKSWNEINAPRYMFSEIPRNMYGDAFVDALKKYLNKSRYTMKVRGQHIKEELKGRGLTEHGQNIEQSTHLRVYIKEKD